MKELETTVEEVLRNALQSEVETRVYYQKMAQRTSVDAVRNRMLELADRELEHRLKLEAKYRHMIGSEPPQAGPVAIELAPDINNLDMSRALKLAVERERDSESYYRFLAERVAGTSELGLLFMELAEVEWKHKSDLQAEYDSTAVDPERFLLDL
jgi:rubrerythrin